VGNHDRSRIGSSAGRVYVRAINLMLLTLPGTPTTYYGEEIGMENINVTQSQIQDPAGKYNAVSFNSKTNTTWLPLHPDYETVNVEVQTEDKGSVLSQYVFLNGLRQSELPFLRGWFCYILADTDVFSYLRELDGHKGAYLMVINFGKGSATTDLSAVQELPEQLKVLMSTNTANDGKVFQKSRILTEPGEGLVIHYSTYTRFHPNHPAECFVSEKACYLETVDVLYKC
ncbi:hypothetical protein XENOCAPTIV_013754, partial [Xenoophorus captivus]